MSEFEAGGHVFRFVPTIGAFEDFKAESGVDLLESLVGIDSDDPSRIMPLLTFFCDPRKVDSCVRCFCRASYEKSGLTEKQFRDLLTGPVIANARSAVVVAIQDFFRESGDSEKVAAIDKAIELIQEAREDIVREISSGSTSMS